MDAPAAAHCALHPESPAVGTCARCGRFACEPCLAEGLCVACAQLVGDTWGLTRPFSVFETARVAAQLVWAEWPRLMLIALLFSVPSALMQHALPSGDDMASLSRSWRATSMFEWLVGTLGVQAMLALLIARGEGRVLTLGQAFNESAMNWNRAVGAAFRSGLWTTLFMFLLIVPGIWQSVMLMFSRIAALRTRQGDALEASRAVVRGRFWACFALGAINFALVLGGIVVAMGVSVALEAVEAPELLNEYIADLITRVTGDVLTTALLYVGFVTLNVSAGTPLPPMRWRRDLPLRQPSQS